MKGSLKFDLSQVSIEELKEELANRKENKREEIFKKLKEILAEAKEWKIDVLYKSDPYKLTGFEMVDGEIFYTDEYVDNN